MKNSGRPCTLSAWIMPGRWSQMENFTGSKPTATMREIVGTSCTPDLWLLACLVVGNAGSKKRGRTAMKNNSHRPNAKKSGAEPKRPNKPMSARTNYGGRKPEKLLSGFSPGQSPQIRHIQIGRASCRERV